MKDLGRQVYLGGEHMSRVHTHILQLPRSPLACYVCSHAVTGAGSQQACLPEDSSAGQLHSHRSNVAHGPGH